MPSIVAKTMFVVSAAMLVIVLAALYVTSRPPAGAQRVVAEFRDAFPLIEGMSVRVGGAIAGSVGKIEVNDEGLAAVTLTLDDEIEPARADATAAIRQQDTTGDSYVAFEPGKADEPLEEADGDPTIVCDSGALDEPCKNTLVAPRFDDLLNSFGPAERAGVQLMLVELSRAVDQRGDDINRAALKLRPALVAANQALAEVNTQNAALRSLIADAEAVTGQAATRREELGRLIDSLASTLEVTASKSEELDAGLERLPETLERAEPTLAALTRAAVAGQPFAEQLRAGAPQLANVLDKAPGFLDHAGEFVERSQTTLELTRKLVVAGAPTIEADPTRVVTGAFDLAPALSNLLKGILGNKDTIKAIFRKEPDEDGGSFGAIMVEPGNQVGYPPEHRNRNFARVSGVFNCESFGLPVAEGCLRDALRAARGASAAREEPKTSDATARSRGAEGARERAPKSPRRLPDLGLDLPGLNLDDLLGPDLGAGLKDRLDVNGDRNAPNRLGRGKRPRQADDRALHDLLDFLLR